MKQIITNDLINQLGDKVYDHVMYTILLNYTIMAESIRS